MNKAGGKEGSHWCRKESKRPMMLVRVMTQQREKQKIISKSQHNKTNENV
jgi:hypothetical protein